MIAHLFIDLIYIIDLIYMKYWSQTAKGITCLYTQHTMAHLFDWFQWYDSLIHNARGGFENARSILKTKK